MLVALVTVLVLISSPVKGCLVYGYSSDNLHHPSSCIFAVLAMLSHSKLTFSSPQTWEKLSELTQSCPLFPSNIQFCTTDIIFLDFTNVFQMWLTLVVIRIS